MARISFAEKNSCGWAQRFCFEGNAGKNGLICATGKREGDGKTPAGIFHIGEAFYIKEKPQTALPTFQITQDTYWVDDPTSCYYNMRVQGTAGKDWNSAEHLIDYPANYQAGFVICYNTARTPGRGSAVFFHCGNAPTRGCVSTGEGNVRRLLAALDPAKAPCIVIGQAKRVTGLACGPGR
jgi:L,D-peptidoglycan transpeptidase YkuD (ErfK/YbiS/YcfS/YnhG family)